MPGFTVSQQAHRGRVQKLRGTPVDPDDAPRADNLDHLVIGVIVSRNLQLRGMCHGPRSEPLCSVGLSLEFESDHCWRSMEQTTPVNIEVAEGVNTFYGAHEEIDGRRHVCAKVQNRWSPAALSRDGAPQIGLIMYFPPAYALPGHNIYSKRERVADLALIDQFLRHPVRLIA